MEKKRGKFIVFEGPDGIGKTTIIEALVKKMSLEKIELITTREPGGTELAEHIRNAIFELGPTKIDKTSQLYLFHASRIIHFAEKIKPALDAGINVICDRHYLSTVVYQQNVYDVVNMTRELLHDYEDVFYNIILNSDDINGVVDRLKNRTDEQNSYDSIDKIVERQQSYNKLFLFQDKLNLVGLTYIVDVGIDLEQNISDIYPIIMSILQD